MVCPSESTHKYIQNHTPDINYNYAYGNIPLEIQPPEGLLNHPHGTNHGLPAPQSATAVYTKNQFLQNHLRKKTRQAAASTGSISSLD